MTAAQKKFLTSNYLDMQSSDTKERYANFDEDSIGEKAKAYSPT